MKKVLSILLALSLIISVIPATFAADGQESNYKFVYHFNARETDVDDTASFREAAKKIEHTYGMWKWVSGSSTSAEGNVRLWGTWGVRAKSGVGSWVAVKINIPVAGTYDLTYTYGKTKSASTSAGGYGDVYLFSGDVDTRDEITGKIATLTETSSERLFSDVEYFGTSNAKNSHLTKNNVTLDASEYVLVLKITKKHPTEAGSYMFFKSITLEGIGTNTVLSGLTSVANKTSLDATVEDIATITTTAYRSDFGTPEVTQNVLYTCSPEGVVSVADNGIVTPVSNGEVEVTAYVTNEIGATISAEPITFVVSGVPSAEPEEPGEVITDTKVSVAVQSEDTNEGTVSCNGATIDEVEMGTTITATATAKEGYVFKFWKNSSGQVLSEKAEESFVINTNYAITAVFDEVNDTGDTVNVELYNANGMPFYTNDKVNKETTFADAIVGAGKPTYTGFGSFLHWSMYADKSKIADNMPIKENTRAVAIFNEPTDEYTVSVDDAPVHSNVLYGTEVTVSSDSSNFSYWKLGEKIVSYDKDYTFTVWGEVDLTEVTEGSVTSAPVATLTTVGSDPLLIYSVPTGYTVVEAGILFGSTANITISSVDGGRAAAARGTGQFTAQPKAGTTSAHSRGYLIFKNNTSGEIRVLYAD